MPVWTLRPGEAGEDELFHQNVTIDIGVFFVVFSDENGWMTSGGFKHFLFSQLHCGEMIQFDEYFSKGLKPPTRSLGGGFC